MTLPIIENMKHIKHQNIAMIVAVLFFVGSIHMMRSLPGTAEGMCVMGANFTPLNVVFSAILAGIIGVIVAGVSQVYHYKAAKAGVAITSISGIATAFGVMTMFCTMCTLPIISIFGVSIGLSAFVYYNTAFKVGSLVLMLISALMINHQLEHKGEKCLVKQMCDLK